MIERAFPAHPEAALRAIPDVLCQQNAAEWARPGRTRADSEGSVDDGTDRNAEAERLRREGDYFGAADILLGLERYADVLVCAREAEIEAIGREESDASPTRVAVSALRREVARRAPPGRAIADCDGGF